MGASSVVSLCITCGMWQTRAEIMVEKLCLYVRRLILVASDAQVTALRGMYVGAACHP